MKWFIQHSVCVNSQLVHVRTELNTQKCELFLCLPLEDVHMLRCIWSSLMKHGQMVAEVAATQVWPCFNQGIEPEANAGLYPLT